MNLIDTAECYGDHLSEQLVGRAVERNRDQWVVARPPSEASTRTRFTDARDTRSSRDAEVLEQRLQEVARIKADEVPEGVDMAAWALAWVLRHPAVTVIPGCKSPEQVEANARAATLAPTEHPQAVAG